MSSPSSVLHNKSGWPYLGNEKSPGRFASVKTTRFLRALQIFKQVFFLFVHDSISVFLVFVVFWVDFWQFSWISWYVYIFGFLAISILKELLEIHWCQNYWIFSKGFSVTYAAAAAFFTRPERPKVGKDEVKRPKGLQLRSRGLKGP